MKLNFTALWKPNMPELIALFGQAQLVKHDTGRYELRGGTRRDHLDAVEWASLFCHEATMPLASERRALASN